MAHYICVRLNLQPKRVFRASSSSIQHPPRPIAMISEPRGQKATATAIVQLSDGTASKLYFFPEETPAGGIYSIEQILDPLQYDPLCSRAWTLQERVLSPRTVYYGVDQMYWACL